MPGRAGHPLGRDRPSVPRRRRRPTRRGRPGGGHARSQLRRHPPLPGEGFRQLINSGGRGDRRRPVFLIPQCERSHLGGDQFIHKSDTENKKLQCKLELKTQWSLTFSPTSLLNVPRTIGWGADFLGLHL